MWSEHPPLWRLAELLLASRGVRLKRTEGVEERSEEQSAGQFVHDFVTTYGGQVRHVQKGYYEQLCAEIDADTARWMENPKPFAIQTADEVSR